MEETYEQEDRKWCVYMHINKENSKVYIGVAKGKPEKRWGNNGRNYDKRQPVFYNAIQKYTWDGFEHIIVETGLTQVEALDLETILISEYKSNCKRYDNPTYGYNMTDGGEGSSGRVPSKETRMLLSKINTERMKNPKLREHLSQKAKEQMSDPNMIRLLSRLKQGVYDGDKNPRYGTGKKVVQLTQEGAYINTYVSAIDAAKQTNINPASLYRCCAHKQKTAGGFLWMYLEEYEKSTHQND